MKSDYARVVGKKHKNKPRMGSPTVILLTQNASGLRLPTQAKQFACFPGLIGKRT